MERLRYIHLVILSVQGDRGREGATSPLRLSRGATLNRHPRNSITRVLISRK